MLPLSRFAFYVQLRPKLLNRVAKLRGDPLRNSEGSKVRMGSGRSHTAFSGNASSGSTDWTRVRRTGFEAATAALVRHEALRQPRQGAAILCAIARPRLGAAEVKRFAIHPARRDCAVFLPAQGDHSQGVE